MAESLLDLLKQYLPPSKREDSTTADHTKYVARLLSLRVPDLTTTEEESLQQSSHSIDVSIQALSSRSYRTATTSFDHLSTLDHSLQALSSSVSSIKGTVPELDESAVKFASSYSKLNQINSTLDARKESMLLSRQADKVQDILELPSLLSATIASASASTSGSANYSQALDLFAHIKRLQILYPESELVKSVLAQSRDAMRDMTINLLTALKGQNLRLASAIRTIGWLRRVLPELQSKSSLASGSGQPTSIFSPNVSAQQAEEDFGAIFLCARLSTFLTMAEALAPLRDLADQETERRHDGASKSQSDAGHRPSQSYAVQGQQTERYLKRYIEIFREQSFATISMFRNVFPPVEGKDLQNDSLQLPTAIAAFPMHLVSIFMETLRECLPNVIDPAARESLLMQVLYAANSLGRLGADFSMFIATLEPPKHDHGDGETASESEWVKVIQKHRVQAARLEALSAGQTQESRKHSAEIAAR